MNEQGIWFFENVNLFNIFCIHKYKEYKANHKFNDFKKGEFIYFKRDLSTKIYLIADGRVKIAYYTDDGKEVVKAILTKGEIFGELALFGEERRHDFAQSVDESTCLCPMTIEEMQNLMLANREFSFKIYKFIGYRIKKLERKIELLISKDVKTRLIEFLKDMAYEKGEKVGDETLIKHAFTQKDIADLIGTSRQTVTTLLNELKEDNLIYFDRKRILVRDLTKLSDVITSN